MELRSLKASDLFLMATIITEIGFKEIKNCFKSDEVIKKVQSLELNDENQENDGTMEVGMTIVFDIAGVILSNLHKSEKHIYELLSRLSGKTTDEIADLDASEFLGAIIDVITNVKNKDFLSLASRFTNLKN